MPDTSVVKLARIADSTDPGSQEVLIRAALIELVATVATLSTALTALTVRVAALEDA